MEIPMKDGETTTLQTVISESNSVTKRQADMKIGKTSGLTTFTKKTISSPVITNTWTGMETVKSTDLTPILMHMTRHLG